MILKKCSIRDFAEQVKNKKVVCFGAYVMPVGMCNTHRELHLEDRIEFLVDNDIKKQGQDFNLCGQIKKIVSPDELAKRVDADTVILITSIYYVAIIRQLEQYRELDNVECFVYPLMQSLYPSHEKVTIRHTKTPLIPKTIHYAWFGGNEKPDIMKRCMESWHKYCPDYEIKEWNESNYDVSKNRFAQEAYNEKKWGFVPDFLRLDVIYHHGGIYLDTDVELVRCMDDLLYNEAYFGLGNYGRINTGLGFGGAKGSGIFKELLKAYEGLSFYKEDGSLNLATCTMRETPVFERLGFVQENRLQIVENATIFPSDVLDPNVPGTDIINVTENTFSIHHAAFTWANKEETKEYQDSIHGTKEIIDRMSDI